MGETKRHETAFATRGSRPRGLRDNAGNAVAPKTLSGLGYRTRVGFVHRPGCPANHAPSCAGYSIIAAYYTHFHLEGVSSARVAEIGGAVVKTMAWVRNGNTDPAANCFDRHHRPRSITPTSRAPQAEAAAVLRQYGS